MSARPVTPVAVGVLLRADGAVLLADRPPGKPYAGYWEFPGGKIEPGESVEQALARELDEELNVKIGSSHPWVVTQFDYPHAYVRLHFRLVREWTGEPHAAEGQNFRFIDVHRPPDLRYLPAAVPALRWLALPGVLLFGPAAHGGAAQSLAWLQDVLGRGARAIVWDPGAIACADRDRDWNAARAQAQAFGARLLRECASRFEQGAHPGTQLYLPARTLHALGESAVQGVGAAGIRSSRDAAFAARIGCDFAVLEADANDHTLAGACALPVYMRGELTLETLRKAQQNGFHGLAIRSHPFPEEISAPRRRGQWPE